MEKFTSLVVVFSNVWGFKFCKVVGSLTSFIKILAILVEMYKRQYKNIEHWLVLDEIKKYRSAEVYYLKVSPDNHIILV